MELIDFGAIIVAMVAALGAWAAQKAASKAAVTKDTISNRLEAERGAYERARAFDIQTIERQDLEIISLIEANQRLVDQLAIVKDRVTNLEEQVAEWEILGKGLR